MINRIIETLKKLEIEKYRINETTESSVELFYVKKNLDTRRIADSHLYTVTLFNDFIDGDKPMRGASETLLHKGMTQEVLEATLKDAYYAASFVKNPTFESPEPIKSDCILMESRAAHQSLAENAKQMADALYKADNRTTSFVNSAEIFATRRDERIVSSEGIDVAYTKYAVTGEFVAQCIKPQDVEQFRQFSYDDLDADTLTKLVNDTLDEVEARAAAFSSPIAGKYDVILTGENLAEVLSYYLTRAGAYFIYPKYSNFAVGQSVQGDEIEGEKLNMTLTARAPFSEEGIKMENLPIISDGILKGIHGGVRFSYYLGIKPTGNYSSFELDNGTVPFDEMKKSRCLEAVSFSDFQMDPFSGHFSGEIRLAYLHENGKTTPLYGGSINGNLFECQKNLTFSTDRYVDSTYRGPFAMLVKDISVAGQKDA